MIRIWHDQGIFLNICIWLGFGRYQFPNIKFKIYFFHFDYRVNTEVKHSIREPNRLLELSQGSLKVVSLTAFSASSDKLDMSTARQRLKSPRSLSGTPAHPTMVTQVNIMVMNGWLTSFSFIVNLPPNSWDKAISDSDLETPRSRSCVWSKGKVIQSAQYHINSLPFHFTSIRPTIPEI